MLRHYFHAALRHLLRHKLYTLINSLSLAFGLTACVVIFLVVQYDLSFDRFHPDANRIYRIIGGWEESTGLSHSWKKFPFTMSTAIKEEVTGIDVLADVVPVNAEIKVQSSDLMNKAFTSKIRGGYITTAFVGKPYFDIFKYEWIAGSSSSALSKPHQVVITDEKAHQYFGSVDVIGRELVYDSLRVTVSGVVRSWKGNTDFPFSDFISIETIRSKAQSSEGNGWDKYSQPATLFLKLNTNVTPDQLDVQLRRFLSAHYESFLNGIDVNAIARKTLELQALSDVHFTDDSNRGNGITHDDGDTFRKANMSSIYRLIAVAAFLLALAVANFINLSSLQSMRRAREIGVRKIFGGSRASIFINFQLETFVQCGIALVVSILLVEPALSVFKEYVPSSVKFDLFNASTAFFLVLITLTAACFSGLYPGTVLSRLRPLNGLRGQRSEFASNGGKEFFRKGLVVFQFTISLVFIVSAIVIETQIGFMKKELRTTNDHILYVKGTSVEREKAFTDALRNLTLVKGACLEGFSPVGIGRVFRLAKTHGEHPTAMGVSVKTGDHNLIPLYGFKLIAGRNFVANDAPDKVVINRTYSNLIGFADIASALGQLIYIGDSPYSVIGVMEDFHEGSLHDPIGPILISNEALEQGRVAIGIDASIGGLQATLNQIQLLWKKYCPNEPFDYRLFDDDLFNLYEKEIGEEALIKQISGIMILVSCLGIFGLSSFKTQARIKEIGIRKVLGASAAEIVSMLSKEIIVMTAIAIFIATPVAWYLMNNWLLGFAYHVDVDSWIFAIAGLIGVTIGLTTISFHSIKAARSNVVDSLRHE